MSRSQSQAPPSPSPLPTSPLNESAPRGQAELPTGGCRFLSHNHSGASRRCCCQGFRIDRNGPGAICECGHNAWVHVQKSLIEDAVPFAVHAALLMKVQRLESHVHGLEQEMEADRKALGEMLIKERRDRERDCRVLREGIRELFEELESRFERKFTETEDRIEGVVDQQSRMEVRIGDVDEAEMALESRVIDLEDGLGDDRLPPQTRGKQRTRRSQTPSTLDEHLDITSSSSEANESPTRDQQHRATLNSEHASSGSCIPSGVQELPLRIWHSTTELPDHYPSRSSPASNILSVAKASSSSPSHRSHIDHSSPRQSASNLVSGLVRMSVPSSSFSQTSEGSNMNDPDAPIIDTGGRAGSNAIPAYKKRKRNLKTTAEGRIMGMVE